MGVCFVAGTLVLAPDGPVPIETVEAGDTVLAWDAATGEVGEHEVLRTFVTPDQAVYAVEVESDGTVDTLQVTEEHSFFVLGRGWVQTHGLQPGMRLRTATATTAEVVSIEQLPGLVTVYNFEVAVAHTYFVGNFAIRVHNNPCGQGGSNIDRNAFRQ